MEWVVNATPWSLYPWEKDLVPILQEAGWAPVPVWNGAENRPSPGFDLRNLQPVASRYTDWPIAVDLEALIDKTIRQSKSNSQFVQIHNIVTAKNILIRDPKNNELYPVMSRINCRYRAIRWQNIWKYLARDESRRVKVLSPNRLQCFTSL